MQALAQIIEASNGQFVSVVFIKKDGTQRTLVGRLGVTKYLAGGKSTLDPAKYITIYDTQNGGYRAINRDTILSVRAGGVEAVRVA
jgi:hypothetical protein